MEQNLLQKLTRPVYCYLNDLWKAITDIKNSIWDIKNDGIGTEKKPVNDIFTKRIKVGKSSIRIDERNINFDSEGTKISGRRIGDELKPFDELHGVEVHASRVGTDLSKVDEVHASKVGTELSKVDEVHASKVGTELSKVDEVHAVSLEGELTGNASTSSGINYISRNEQPPSSPKEGDFWLDITQRKLKIRFENEWKEIQFA